MNLTWKKFFILTLILSFALSAPGLKVRWKAESSRRSSVILGDWRQIADLASQEDADPATVLKGLVDGGLRGLMVGEATGKELSDGVLPVWYGSVSELPRDIGSKINSEGFNTALIFPAKGELYGIFEDFLELRFRKGKAATVGDSKIFLIPLPKDRLSSVGILPDIKGLDTAKELSLPVIYRPAPRDLEAPESVSDTVDFMCGLYQGIVGLAPSGEIVSGYPDLSGLKSLIERRNLFLAQVEFSRQIGDKALQWAVWPRLLSLHSVTDEEVMSRRIDGKTMEDRMVRAAVERSVSLLFLRMDPMGGGKDLLGRYSAAVSDLRERLARRGIDDRWPAVLPNWSWSPTGALALSVVFLLYGTCFYRRVTGNSEDVSLKFVLVMALFSVALALGIMRISLLNRFVGAFSAALAVTEGTLLSLENWKKPGRAMILGPLTALAGGLAIGSFYGIPLYMMRLKTFSGVKLTLFLPAALVFFHDMVRRVHPESFGELLFRPPVWAEIFLAGFLCLGALFMVYRSGNVSFVPGWEIRIRDWLERGLVARPRTKEAFFGYPSLILWFMVRRKDLMANYREIFRLGTVAAFGSLVNSFCHFHTNLYFTLWRVFNGWWVGMIIGLTAVVFSNFALMPMIKRFWRPKADEAL